MQWGEVEQVQLRRFLEGFTSPDPVVQTSNLEQLQALSQYPSSLLSTLAIVGDAAASVTVRLSATTVARQLLRCTDRLPLYLSASGDDPTRAVQSIVEALLDAALGGLHSPSSATTTTPLQRATGGLIACLLSALAHTSLVTTATSVLSNLISFLLHRTDPATLIMHDVHEERRWHIVQCWSRCSTLLREICEGPLSTSKVLREWVGGQESQSLALCSLFSQLLQLLEEQMGMEWAASGAAARLSALWLEDTLTAFQTCIDSGVLPCGASYLLNAPTSDCPTTSSAADRSSTGPGDGPSAQALRTVCAAVHRVQSSAQGLILRRVLGTLAYSTDERTDGPLLRERVVVTAPFVALSMRYMADAVALETIEALHDVFHTAATPLLASFCRAVRRAQLQYDGAGEPDSAHAAVLACIHYITEWLHAESTRLSTPSIRPAGYPAHPSMTSAPTVDCASCLYSMLIDAATLPTSIAEALEEHTTVRADSASDLLARSVAGRRRGPRSHRTQEACDGQVCISAEPPKENRNSVTALKEAQRDKQDAVVLADMLEVELPDNGTLRQAVAWCAVALSCHQMWMMAVAPLVVRFTATPLQGNLAAACAMESTLFVSNELLDSVIADDKVSASIAASTPQLPEQNLVSHALCVLSLLSPRTEDGAGTRPPFFVCIQAVRYIGRLLVGFLDAWEYTLGAGHANQSSFRLLERTRTVMAPTGGLDRLLALVLGRLTTESSKATQVECVKTLDAALTACLKVMEHLVRSPMNGGDKSDLEEESLDSTSCLSGDTSAGDGEEDEAGHPFGDEPFERARVFCQSFGITPDLRIVADVLHLVSSHLPSFQWSVREAVYHLLSQVLPLLWRTAPLVDSLFPKRADGTGLEAAAASSARIVTVHALEAMAQHYSTLLSASSVSDNASPMLEMATLLMSMADVTSAMDGGTLGVVVPWILQVAHHMLSVYARFLTSRAYSDHSPMADRAGEIVNMTDMCMVSLDLVSCVCDGAIDRDALLEQQLRPDGAGEAFRTMDARLMALAESLLLPIATSDIKGDGTPSSDSGCEALPNRCMALLGVCQSLSDHPTNASTESNSVSANGAVADEASYPLDEFGEVRRACFAIVYDCIFLAAYPSSLFRPLDVAVAPSTGSVSGPICLSDSLGRDLFALCMREVLPCTNSSLPNRHTQFMDHPRCISAHNVAASDAWLCLGSLLSLWDQQHWRTRFTAPNGVGLTCEGESGPRSVFYMCEPESLIELHSHCLLTLNGLLSRLQDKSATIASSMRLNMTTAACGLALLLCCNPGHSHTNPGVLAPLCPLSFANISAVFSVTSSNRIQSYAADASSGDLTGINEAAHVLWCLGRLWQEAVQPLPHDALCAFLRSHGREIAKTISWWTRCVFGAKKQVPPAEPSALVSHTFWESLLELWRPVAHTLVQATRENALSLAKAQLSTLGRLVQL
ncbi:hypothetical protein JKF63_03896 [Porcisia hertigi]|uniref:Uncharacterized protein n=1 Tax=Porcisia hertigi TaxID=2761500 RepID=A0A836L3R7_9TRYP|nr:hypothetical protein JKF63_03896 [Porcisia hertigi]